LKKERIYLDTWVPSAYYDERTRERQEATIKFWDYVLPDFSVYVSEITIEELLQTRDETLKTRLKNLVKQFEILKINKEIEALAQAYIDNKIIPVKYIDDARHAAAATFYEINYLISWNFEHLVKIRKKRLINSVNILHGFGEIEIISPQEL